MPAERLSMRKGREILRLLWHMKLGLRPTAYSCKVSHSTVVAYQQRAREAGLSWEEVASMDAGQLEEKLFPAPSSPSSLSRPLPDWGEVHQELQRPGVTRQLVWEEYKAAQPAGYQYSRFSELYRQWRAKLDLSMRQTHTAGEKLFVDYCGQTVPVVDPSTGEERSAQIFVSVLGASNYTYAVATWSQSLPDWIGSHVRALTFYGGVPSLLIPDNLKSGVTQPCRYEPDLNPTYQELAEHYGTAVMPARVRKPKDKAKVEVGVQVVERWILACLRHRRFFSLGELNAAIRELLERFNERPFKKLAGSRRSQFEALDQPALSPLPAQRYEYADWYKVRVGPDYHVEVEGHYYSVPYQLVGEQLEARVKAQTVECLHRGRRVALHVRSAEIGACTTVLEHMPRSHRSFAEWTPSMLVEWARSTGPAAAQMVETILTSKPHPYQGFQSAMGLRNRLAKRYGSDRLEAACRRAVRIGAFSFKSVRSILQHGLDGQEPPPVPEQVPILEHDNVRGAAYYQSAEIAYSGVVGLVGIPARESEEEPPC